jgi:hypothetical protein
MDEKRTDDTAVVSQPLRSTAMLDHRNGLRQEKRLKIR